MEEYDVIVSGAGPGGSTAAAYLAMRGKKVLLIDKATFPRDKTCGDALGGKSLRHVQEIGAHDAVTESQHYEYTKITMSSANGNSMTISLAGNEFAHNTAGFVIKRELLDNCVFDAASKHVNAAGGKVIQNAKVLGPIWKDKEGNGDPGHGSKGERVATGITYFVDGKKVQAAAEIIVGAGGYNCPIARELIVDTYEERYEDGLHWSAAYREYYENVEGCEPENGAMEIHFVDGVIPGYFWIFPAGDGLVNVGTGMLIDYMKKNKVKLKQLQHHLVNEHPKFKQRFQNSTLIEGSGKGWKLPLGSPRGYGEYEPRRMAGCNIILVGDAASLIDPFTGEGIGNAMVSGELACHAVARIDEGMNIDESLIQYQKEIWDTLGPELTNSDKFQKLLLKKRLMNWFIGKASKKPKLQAALTDMLASKEAQKGIHSKWFILRSLLF